jgi:Dyp-type peroxidase family
MTPPTDEPTLALDEIQGNVIPGFLKDHQHFLFFSITDAPAARKCLARLNSRLCTASEVLKAHELYKSMRGRLGHEPDAAHYVFKNVALSAAGLRKLTPEREVDLFEGAFKVGLSDRSEYIGDPKDKNKPGHVSQWVVGGSVHPVDVVLILASDDLPWLLEESKKLTAEISSQGMSLVHEDRGDANAAPEHGHEQFGFKDNISRPVVRGRWPKDPFDFVFPRKIPGDKIFETVRKDFADPGNRLIWPGHFIFGYGRQKGDHTQAYDRADQAKGPPWARNGSLMVYRRLRQNVDEFKRFVEKTATDLTRKHPAAPIDADRLGALLIGRWKSGTPLVRSPLKDIGITGDSLNYFSYAQEQTPALPKDTWPNSADPEGNLCPLGAHIRKVNPRDQTPELGLSERTPRHSLLRRGITYSAGADDKGLLFVAYQTSLAEQFEFLMRFWINRPEMPRSGAGEDPILSQNSDRVFHLQVGGAQEAVSIPTPFIVPTGGEYFFSPSTSFFKDVLARTSQS